VLTALSANVESEAEKGAKIGIQVHPHG
jgi:hypothetical protein